MKSKVAKVELENTKLQSRMQKLGTTFLDLKDMKEKVKQLLGKYAGYKPILRVKF